MAGDISRRAFLSAIAAAAGQAALADAPLTSLRPQGRPSADGQVSDFDPGATAPVARPSLEQIVADSRVTGSVSLSVSDLSSGEELESLEGESGLPPASVTKSLTAVYALEHLGPDHRFATRLLATAPVVDGTLDGDLILAGSGNPTLATDDLATLAADLKAAGVLEVTGRFLVYGNALPYEDEIDPGQLDHLGYNPAVSGLNLNYNRVHFEWARQGSDYTVGLDARSDTLRPTVSTARMTVVDRGSPVYTYTTSNDIDEWTVARSQLGDGGSRWLPVRQPALYAGDVFRTLARSHGILLSDAQKVMELPEGTELARHESEPLVDILEDMLRWSTNLTAEVVGLAATAASSGRPETIEASAQAMSGWLERSFGVASSFVDHSGLGDENRISAIEMVKYLTADGVKERLYPILKVHDLKDDEGAPIQNYPADVRAKTGTLNFVSALAGYITTAEGNDLAFAIFCGDMERREASKLTNDEIPEGSRYFNGTAKGLQQDLLQRWGLIYSG
ncbi:D-alanyl-D-alanine carboxypeptidase/D-alanyl-D-alanine-endopeptidase [Pelagovum pacificum]|uniref:D-alanyl-D-alanine carboxypeptidase/D-alanyl-D-alanine-endopeptidase n=1 Tax=Pelagovum pacificum TaxID=2588711 RepID=A0A5C5GCJ2_9RHOB|nr:D-alanyl-D-alanine carboxypeptidase/D-alanyl-D-alanine-endopeptidase [Pelagovum pacificum]QQA42223.1 D-alanyl-D-alanine carboxypeptidase/D-alanyl-D-alanine-endopeptidase [Pelagovum pacificum]TNY31309.1 D-alanyl-D-alanine carboxypeptidase/D-alanyl-D-alanine-endopeptidase [Pelagovum pacificum]